MRPAVVGPHGEDPQPLGVEVEVALRGAAEVEKGPADEHLPGEVHVEGEREAPRARLIGIEVGVGIETGHAGLSG